MYTLEHLAERGTWAEALRYWEWPRMEGGGRVQLGRFGSLVGFAVQVIGGGVALLFPAAGYFLIAVGTAVLLAAIGHGVYSHRKEIAEWRQRVGIVTILLLIGIAGTWLFASVALGALAWRLLRTPGNPIVSQTIPATIPAPAPVLPAWQTLRRQYIGRSKELFDENLTTISRLLNGQGNEAVRLASLIARDMAITPPEIRPDRYASIKPSALQAQDLLEQVHKKIYDQMLVEYRDQSADLTDVLERPDALAGAQSAIRQIVNLYDTFESLSKELRPEMQHGAKVLFGEHRESLQRAMNEFSTWVMACNNRIEAKRKALVHD